MDSQWTPPLGECTPRSTPALRECTPGVPLHSRSALPGVRGVPTFNEVLSGSYEAPVPSPMAVVVIEGLNASPTSLLRQNLNQRFEDTAQNRRRSGRERKKPTVFDPSTKKR